MYEPPERFNLATYLLDARLDEGAGSRIAIRTADRTFTYREVAVLSARVANFLASSDVRPEERVIIALPDGPIFVAALLGSVRHGAVAVMVNPDLPPDAIRYFFEYTRARAALVDPSQEARFAAAASGLASQPQVIAVDAAFEARLSDLPDSRPAFDSHRDDAAIWLFSGGTTGKPKAVVQSHRSYANTTELYGKGVLKLHESDITLAVPKLFFGYAMGSNVFFPFSVGASCVLFPARSTPDEVFSQIRRHRPTVLINVPTLVQQMVAHPDASSQDLSCLRLATSAGEALPAELYTRWKERFGVELLDGLGTAEMWHIFISNRPGEVVPGTIGRVVPGFEVKLCDTDGREVADGDVGALWVKGRSRAIGYWQRLDDSMQAFRGPWYVSGDMLRRHADGTFEYCGRSDDMLKVSGRWLAPGELENCLLQHPRVREVAVVGVTDAAGLTRACAFVVADAPGAELGIELQAFVKSRLEPYKYPREVVFLQTLPRTHLGKVDRGRLATGQASVREGT